MEPEHFEPLDILSFTTQELEERYEKSKEDSKALAKVFNDFLKRWYADSMMDSLRNMKLKFESDLDWFNVQQQLSLECLRGKLIVLDFFTYCCINCMHVLPELHALEELFPIERGLVVIGVHSPKFENEKDPVNILNAVQRYHVTHPIVNDPQMKLWNSIGIRCWPSLLVLSPKGEPLLLLMGEGHGQFLQSFIEHALNYFHQNGGISTFAIPMSISNSLPCSNVKFPAKICRGADGQFAVADAGNHRILVFNKDGSVLYRVGGNLSGFMDGNFKQARFNSPQGVTFLESDILIVADTENHALRQITLSKNLVETLAGTGKQGSDRSGGKLGTLQEIASPWDVAVFRTRDMDMSFHLDEKNVPEKTIILASMSGTHQIWGYFPEGIIWWKFRKFEPKICVPLVGNGLEENRNNSYPQNAAFAQPSGLAIANDCLYIADSESSSIRKVSMVDGKVSAVVGGDRNPLNLFAFGDLDGKQYNAKLQHPLGVTYNHTNRNIYVADTYNHKIKVIDPSTNSIETLNIANESNEQIYNFKEPSGLCFDESGNFLFVSDTNNHCIRMVDIRTLKIKPFSLKFSNLQATSETDSPLGNISRSGLQLIKLLPLRSYKQLNLTVSISLDNDLKFTSEAPQKWKLSTVNSALNSVVSVGDLKDGKLSIQMKRSKETIPKLKEDIKLDFSLGLCDAKSCLMKKFSLILNDVQNENQGNSASGQEIINIHITQSSVIVK